MYTKYVSLQPLVIIIFHTLIIVVLDLTKTLLGPIEGIHWVPKPSTIVTMGIANLVTNLQLAGEAMVGLMSVPGNQHADVRSSPTDFFSSELDFSFN